MKHNIFRLFLFLITFSTLFTSCVEDEYEELGDQGQTFIKIQEAPENQFFFSPFTDTKKLDLFSLRREANSNAELNATKTIQLVSAPEMIETYNNENGETFEALPEDAYTIANESVQKTTNGYTFNFAGGDFAQDFTINLNGSKWVDLGKKYALGFRVTDAQGSPLASGKDSVLVLLSIKNKYDGNYEVEATSDMVDVVNPALTGYYPLNSDLHTTGPNSVVMFERGVLGGLQGHPITSAGAASYYGSFAPVFTMDDAGNVISVTNFYGQPAGNGRSARLNPDGVNKFTIGDDGSKTLEVSYIMVQAGNDRTFFQEKWTYKGER